MAVYDFIRFSKYTKWVSSNQIKLFCASLFLLDQTLFLQQTLWFLILNILVIFFICCFFTIFLSPVLMGVNFKCLRNKAQSDLHGKTIS